MSRILETILPELIRNEGMLFVPQILEDLMRGKLDRGAFEGRSRVRYAEQNSAELAEWCAK